MSILIKGMSMPMNCETCELSSTDSSGFFGCCVTGSIVMRKREQDRPPWCPLVELPPHGRLGDLDRLEQMFVDIDNAPYSGFDGENPFYSAEDAAQIIRLAPTIIEAEETNK